MVARINWTTASAGAKTVPCLLIAGCPWAIVPAGVSLTAVTWSSGADAAWHVGTTPTSKGWLDTTSAAPDVVVEERTSPVQGTVDISAVTIHLADVSLEVTAFLGSLSVIPFVLLSQDLSATDVTIHVDTAAPFPAAGTVHLGRERITYTGTTPTTLTGCTRGTQGTKARRYLTAQKHRVYGPPAGGADVLPSILGRRATVWMLRMVGTTATDPSLVFDGRCGAGGRLSNDGAGWEIPIDHVTKVMGTKSTAPTVNIYGYSHYNSQRRSTDSGGFGRSEAGGANDQQQPVTVEWLPQDANGVIVMLTDASGAIDRDGWHPTRASYIAGLNASVGAAPGLALPAMNFEIVSGFLNVWANSLGGPDRRLTVGCAWDSTWTSNPASDGDAVQGPHVITPSPMPAACQWLSGQLYLDTAAVAQIPSVPGAGTGIVHTGGGYTTYAYWTLTVPAGTGFGQPRTADIYLITGNVLTMVASSSDDRDGHIITSPTGGVLGLHTWGGVWWDVLRYGVLDQIDDLHGIDQVSDSVDWDRIAAVAPRAAAWLTGRDYYIDLSKPILDTFRNEGALNGCLCLATYHGRLAYAGIREVTATEHMDATITKTDLRRDAAPPAMTDVRDGLASGYKLTFPSGDILRIIDGSAIAECGEGVDIEATAPFTSSNQAASGSVMDDAFQQLVSNYALPAVHAWSRAYRTAVLPLTLKHAGLEVGSILSISEWVLPNGSGTRGLSSAPAVVMGRRVNYSKGTVDLTVRLSSSGITGYAPEALVASVVGAVVTLDTTTLGTHGFAPADETDAGASYFTVGDPVLLHELDTTTPAAPFSANVLSISGAAITLDANPGAPWTTWPLTLLAFDRHAAANAGQHRYAYIVDNATLTFPDSTFTRRFV